MEGDTSEGEFVQSSAELYDQVKHEEESLISSSNLFYDYFFDFVNLLFFHQFHHSLPSHICILDFYLVSFEDDQLITLYLLFLLLPLVFLLHLLISPLSLLLYLPQPLISILYLLNHLYSTFFCPLLHIFALLISFLFFV